MKQQKIAILVLVLLVILFIGGLSSGYLAGNNGSDGDFSIEQAKQMKDKWVGSLDNFLALFSQKLNTARLSPQPSIGQNKEKTYRLANAKERTIFISSAKKGDKEVQRATLRVKKDKAKMRVCAEPQNKSTRAMPKKKVPATFATNIIRPEMATVVGLQKIALVDIWYVPTGKQKGNQCEQSEELPLAVLEEGGKLIMKCHNCSNKRSVTVTLE